MGTSRIFHLLTSGRKSFQWITYFSGPEREQQQRQQRPEKIWILHPPFYCSFLNLVGWRDKKDNGKTFGLFSLSLFLSLSLSFLIPEFVWVCVRLQVYLLVCLSVHLLIYTSVFFVGWYVLMFGPCICLFTSLFLYRSVCQLICWSNYLFVCTLSVCRYVCLFNYKLVFCLYIWSPIRLTVC